MKKIFSSGELPPPPPPPPPTKKEGIGKTIILIIVVIAVLGVAAVAAYFLLPGLFGGGLPSADEIISKSYNALKNVNTYKFDLSMSIKTKVMGTTVTINMDGHGAVDYKSKKMKMAYTFQGMNYEIYIIGDTMYIKILGRWYKTTQKGLWERQEMINASISLMEKLKAEVKGVEKVDGRDAYKVEITPGGLSEKELTDIIMETISTGYSNIPTGLQGNITIKSFSSTVWIDKETYVVLKTVSDMEMEMKSNVGSVTSEIHSEWKIKDINKPVSIVLPPEAKNAKPLSTFQGGWG